MQAALTVRLLLNPDSKSQSEQDLLSTLDLEDATIQKTVAGLDLLNEWGSDQAAKTAYIEKAHKKWDEASAFKTN